MVVSVIPNSVVVHVSCQTTTSYNACQQQGLKANHLLATLNAGLCGLFVLGRRLLSPPLCVHRDT